ncbi:MAG TPA: hypothetical protein VGP76_26615 [Planctomycetaceae bacterium]|jgi:hypothetical protein|nr:hypothetical protein [Planctomycetaceae bacterium]
MKSESCTVTRSTRIRAVVVVMALIGVVPIVAGCGSKPGQSLDDQLKELNTTRHPTAKFAGTVTIDGKPPRDAIKQGLRIMLYDPKNPPASGAAPLNAIVRYEDGSFDFSTYGQADGAPEGSYVVLFAALKHSLLGKQQGYHEPDALKNLYNDPDKNAEHSEFKIDIARPGKTDYQFDLVLEGKEAVTPGPKAITRFN